MTLLSLLRRLLLISLLLLPLLVAHSVAATTRFVDAVNGRDDPRCLSNSSLACWSLGYVLSNETSTGLDVQMRPGEYVLSNEVTVEDAVYLSIRADPARPGEVVVRCAEPLESGYNNLAIYRGHNITVAGITVKDCGPWPAGIFMRDVKDGLVKDCIFKNNSGGGLWLYNVDTFQVENCLFTENTNTRPEFNVNLEAGNPISQNAGGLGINFIDNSRAKVTVHNCMFRDNSASVNAINFNDSRPQSYVSFGHGGAMDLRFDSNTSNITVEISNCVFDGNSAIHSGGGIYVSLIHNPRNNHLLIHNSTFINCTSQHSGGSVSLQVFVVEENNSVLVEDSHFQNCSAREGGGAISVILEDTLASTYHNDSDDITILNMVNCTFKNNYSPTGGSAVGLVSNARVDQFSFITRFENCVFSGNQANKQGAFFTFRFRSIFNGSILFLGNQGGAMLIFQTKVDCQGRLMFEGNTATRGGAITLVDQSFLNMASGTEMTFLNNRAELRGGAILVNNPAVSKDVDPVFNTFCFFQYEVETEGSVTLTPDQWNATVNFSHNTAGVAGAAIYASDLTVCTFTTTKCQEKDPNTLPYEKSLFSTFSSSTFSFEGNMLERIDADEIVHDVATEAYTLTVTSDVTFSAPGDSLHFTLQATDQSGNTRAAIWTYTDSDASSEFLQSSCQALERKIVFQPQQSQIDNCPALMGGDSPTGEVETLQFFIIQGLTGQVAFNTSVDIHTSCCHPGYKQSNNTCVFDSQYSHLLRPEPENIHVYLQRRYYAGFYEDDALNETYFVTVLMPSSFQSCEKERERTGCLYRYNDPDSQCRDNRTGFMCGSCPVGQGVDLTLRHCKKCEVQDTIGMVFICILVVVGCSLVLAFNIGVPTDLTGFLFFAQVVGFVYLHRAESEGLQAWDYHLSHFLGFSLYLPICPFTSLTALWAAAFGILPSILAIMTVTIYIICARIIKPLANHTVFRGIWLISLFVYKYIADTVANILKCVALEGEAVHMRHSLKLVFYYDGNVPCFLGEHLGLAIPALLLLVFVVVLGPAFVILISFKRFKSTQAFTDVITDGVKLKMRWWGGFDLLRRLMFIITITLMDSLSPDYSQLCLCLVSLLILGVLSIAKPYTHKLVNLIEALILFDLLLISFIFLNSKDSAKVNPAVFVILLLLPFIYAFINITIKIVLIIWKRKNPSASEDIWKLFPEQLQSYFVPPGNSNARKKMVLQKTTSLDRSNILDTVEWKENGEDGQKSDTTFSPNYTMYREELLNSTY